MLASRATTCSAAFLSSMFHGIYSPQLNNPIHEVCLRLHVITSEKYFLEWYNASNGIPFNHVFSTYKISSLMERHLTLRVRRGEDTLRRCSWFLKFWMRPRASGRSDWVPISDGCGCGLRIRISTLEVVPSADWHPRIDGLIRGWGIILRNCFGYIEVLHSS